MELHATTLQIIKMKDRKITKSCPSKETSKLMFFLLVPFLYKVIIITQEQIFIYVVNVMQAQNMSFNFKNLLKQEDASELLFFLKADYKT